jgi:hypothetical protein
VLSVVSVPAPSLPVPFHCAAALRVNFIVMCI